MAIAFEPIADGSLSTLQTDCGRDATPMSNIVEFRGRGSSERRSSTLAQSTALRTDVAVIVSRLELLKSKAREEMHRAIFLLELASQKIRMVAKGIGNPAAKSDIESQIAAVERLLEIARHKVLQLDGE